MLNLKGKIAVVTGCGSIGAGFGNGRAIATVLARQGATVIGTDINEEAGQNTCDFINKEGNNCIFFKVNMTDDKEVKKFFDQIKLKNKRLDILVNNVGQSEPGGPVEIDTETWQQQFALNLDTSFFCIKFAIPIMEKNNGGSIVNISSVAGIRYVGKPQVAYRESIKKYIEEEAKFVRQSGGRGQYGHVYIKMEPLIEPDEEKDQNYQFVNEIVGGAIPREFIGAVDKGCKEQMEAGVIAGYPLVKVKVTLYDGSYHDVDSSEVAFKVAGSMAFKGGAKKADPVLLEPIMSIEIVTPEEYMGDVVGDLSRRRGVVQGMEDGPSGKIVSGEVPLAEMFGYATDIRSASQGRATFTMEPLKYSEVQSNVAEAIISKND